jgi:hypothetical protein
VAGVAGGQVGDAVETATMAETRAHPDLFTPAEAATYLHLESVHTLETLEREHKLQRLKAGKCVLYWRKDLDAVAYSIAGEPVPAELKRVKPLTLHRERA